MNKKSVPPNTVEVKHTLVRPDQDGGHAQGDLWTKYGTYMPPPKKK